MSGWYRTILQRNYDDTYKSLNFLTCPLIRGRKYKNIENSISIKIWSSKKCSLIISILRGYLGAYGHSLSIWIKKPNSSNTVKFQLLVQNRLYSERAYTMGRPKNNYECLFSSAICEWFFKGPFTNYFDKQGGWRLTKCQQNLHQLIN